MMDAAWASVAISGIGMVGAIAGSFFGTKLALARLEERLGSQGQHLGRLQDQVNEQGGVLGDHAVRIGVLENEVGLRAPIDYPRRG